MGHEQLQPDEGFGFTEREQLFERISDDRLKAILTDEQTIVHEIAESSNNNGDFLFVTVSRPAGERRISVTFWGLGYHDYRERWLTDEWFWYRDNGLPETMSQMVGKEEAEERLRQRLEEISPYVTPTRQSRRARLFEMLADLTDGDGTYTELEDLEDMGYLGEDFE